MDEAAKIIPIQTLGGSQSSIHLQEEGLLLLTVRVVLEFQDIGHQGMKIAIQPAIRVKATNPRNILIPKIRRSLGVSRIRNENARLTSAASRTKMPQ